jgi:hypothetical protein
MTSRSSSLLSFLILVAACGGGGEAVRGDEDLFAPERLYPLRPDNVWSFNVYDGNDPNPTLTSLRVTEADGNRRTVVAMSGAQEVYELRPDGIWSPMHEVYLLKAPIRVDARWPARSGREARVSSTSRTVDVPAGRFEGCVVIEETGGAQNLHIETVYCPDVGPVLNVTRMEMEVSVRGVEMTTKLLAFDVAP